MALNLNKPGWQNATPAAFASLNPLIKGDVILETYEIEVEEKDTLGESIGSHIETCVTHNSLLLYYQRKLLPSGVQRQYSDPKWSPDGKKVAVKCTLEKKITKEEFKTLTAKGFDVNDDIIYHVESIGEASSDNCKSYIAATHLVNTAENRSFDRAMFSYLSLDIEGNGVIYSTSDEIGKPVEKDEEEADGQSHDWFQPVQTEQKPAVQYYQKPADNAVAPVAAKAPVPASAPAVPAPAVKPVAPAQMPAAAPAPARETDTTEITEIMREVAACAKEQFEQSKYDWMLEQKFQLSKSPFNGKTFRELIEVLQRYKGVKELPQEARDAQIAAFTLMKYKPKHLDQIPAWKIFISYMAKINLLIFYPSGKYYIRLSPNKKEN